MEEIVHSELPFAAVILDGKYISVRPYGTAVQYGKFVRVRVRPKKPYAVLFCRHFDAIKNAVQYGKKHGYGRTLQHYIVRHTSDIYFMKYFVNLYKQ